ncbi:2-oxoglutarate dehydrogenase complex dihydrolipoyllysine-residue succinyltransferase [Candidatus Spongiihabitans sp.]|uniref:2-oxoglutarate dehydrogenase complex dihydrolipoyllysine-residue succinyltransferase n=1 Tax=Candidatus Spongiihabitans sp. TaxID=3101308 RepID=UPI003C7DAD90
MPIEIKVPVLPESVADALVLDWAKQVGDGVSRDEILVEVETDKVVLEVPAPQDGVLVEIVEQSGATVLAEQVLARFEPGAVGDADDAAAGDDDAKDAPQPAPGATADDDGGDGDNATAGATADDHADKPLSPAVRRLIDETGIAPQAIAGSGRDGRLTKQDVLRHIADAKKTARPAAPTAVAPVAQPAGERQETREPMSRLRQTIAKRLVQSQQTAALLTTFNEVNMQPIMALRAKYKEAFAKKHGAKLGFMSFFVKASAAALQRFPLVNAGIDGTDIVHHNYHDIGIAVSSPRGLVVPVLRNCEALGYAEIESQIQDFAARAGQGKIAIEELTGGTFTITNGGVFGSLLSTPIVNPPQSAILGMHKIQQRPMAEDGEVVIRPMMYLALSYDHRLIDGQEAVQFLVTVKDVLEDPPRLLLDV